jgi:hypothetical protein
MNVEQVMEIYSKELSSYEKCVKYPDGMVLHISTLGNTGYYIGTLTAYDREGKKSENAFPLSTFMNVVSEIESLLKIHRTLDFTGQLIGWNPTSRVKNFLYNKKVHRFFFIPEDSVLPFVKSFTHESRIAERKNMGVDLLVVFG